MESTEIAHKLVAIHRLVNGMMVKAADVETDDALGYLSDVLEHMIEDLSDGVVPETEFRDARLDALFA